MLRLNCQWQTDPMSWFNFALVSNPFPVTHNFLLTSEQLGQPAGEKTSRCGWLELQGLWTLIQTVPVDPGVRCFPLPMWVGRAALSGRFHSLAHKCVKQVTASLLCLQFQDVLLGGRGFGGGADRPLPGPSAEGIRDNLTRMYHPPWGLGLTHRPQLEYTGKAEKLGGRGKKRIWLGGNKLEQRLLYRAHINLV